jgi:PilZ domain-containing protein
MDSPLSIVPRTTHHSEPAQAVLAEVTCSWGEGADDADSTLAAIVHVGRDMLVLEAADPARALPPMGSALHVVGATLDVLGRIAEHGRAGRFLVSMSNRPVRRDLRLRVSLTGVLRSAALSGPVQVEIADLTTSGAKVRGIELPSGSQVALDFIPPGRDDTVTVRARVAHTSTGSTTPWIGLVFRLVALRGGR